MGTAAANIKVAPETGNCISTHSHSSPTPNERERHHSADSQICRIVPTKEFLVELGKLVESSGVSKTQFTSYMIFGGSGAAQLRFRQSARHLS